MHPRPTWLLVGLVLGAGAAFALGCATPSNSARYQFFSEPDREADPWYGKVEAWQGRARRDHIARVGSGEGSQAAQVARSGLLRNKMASFQSDEQRALARRINDFALVQARQHYRFDRESDWAGDHWPTVKELLETNGDDCDGLDLIAYQLLQEFGFPQQELYRAIVKRNRDGANHMVTLCFESRDNPWVLDATGAVSMKMRKFSDLPGWTPTVVFNENEQFSVAERPRGSFSLARD